MRVKYFFYTFVLLAFATIMINFDDNQKCEITCGPGMNELLKSNAAIDPHQYPAEWMARQRMYPHDRSNTQAHLSEMKAAAKMQNAAPSRFDWEPAGPENIGGRITDIEVNPENPDVFYVAAATGGILKTTDGGQSWDNIFDDKSVITIGDLALDPDNSEIIYAGTGEANASSFNFVGDGIHKSLDGGQTWEHLGLENSGYIGRVVVDHNNSDRVFVAANGNLFSANDERGVYRSIDGGQNWERVLYLTDSTAAIDLVQHPENPEILIAAMWERVRGLNYRRSFGNSSGLWKTIDGGDTWYELTNGLPTGSDVGRIGVDIARSNPDIVYAFYDNQYAVKVYKSQDTGESWSATSDGDIQGMNSNFGWYFGQIRVDPADENQFYLLGMELWKSSTGGNSYTGLAGYWNSWEIHVDHHAMWIDENTGRIFEGNDGGLYYSDNEGSSWTKINNVPLVQFYHIEIDYLNPQRIYGGTQDNNTIRTLTGNLDDWDAILGGDGMYCQVDYTNSNIIYAESQWGNLARSFDLGNDFDYIAGAFENDRKNWSSPFKLHPEDPTILYFGTYRLWKGTNYGDDWEAISGDLTMGDEGSTFHTIATLDISTHHPEYLLTGADDGMVYISTNDGDDWENISDGLPQRSITSVVFDPFDENTIYITLSGMRWDEHTPHVFKSTNLGQDWINISNGLPDIPVNELVCDPEYPGRLILATDGGIFMCDDDLYNWYGISSGMPNTACVSMQIHVPTRDLVVGTYGNSCFKIHLDDLWTGVENRREQKLSEIDFNISPNPISENSSIWVNTENETHARIDVFTLEGKFVATVFDGLLTEGENIIPLNVRADLEVNNAGVYVCKLSIGKAHKTEKIIIAK
ncbi:MAG: T9SS type A sorting domain-containing protein [Bacteroidales bacterium]|nr:T9SS type A sorting domain-containing protein [Bacteroidales bacterium]